MAPSWLTMPVRIRKVPTPPLLHGTKHAKASPQASDEDAGVEEKEIALERHASRPGTTTTTRTLRDLEPELGPEVDKKSGVRTGKRTEGEGEGEGEGSGAGESSRSEWEGEGDKSRDRARRGVRVHDGSAGARHDPEEYHEAKKKLKKAVQECYRCVISDPRSAVVRPGVLMGSAAAAQGAGGVE